jgi:hypothetical protein
MREIQRVFGIGAIVAAVIGAGVLCWLVPTSPRDAGAPTLVSFRQGSRELEIGFNRSVGEFKYIALPSVPARLDPQALRRDAIPVECRRGVVRLPLSDEPSACEHSVLLFADGEWIEFVRQSPQWLKQNFDFDKPDGYTILGRRSISVLTGQDASVPALTFHGRPALDVAPCGSSKYPEVCLAEGLMKQLWQEPLKQGPTSLSYDAFLQLPYAEKLRRIRFGEFAVMCQGTRDMFLHGSEGVAGLKARGVEAYNYSPQLAGLTCYGHSTAEIYIAALRKWVLFDPWLAIMVTDTNGVPVGAEDLTRAVETRRTEGLTVAPLAEKLERTFRRADGSIVVNPYRPANTRLTEFTVNDLGCTPGYIEYFRHVLYHEHKIVDQE